MCEEEIVSGWSNFIPSHSYVDFFRKKPSKIQMIKDDRRSPFSSISKAVFVYA